MKRKRKGKTKVNAKRKLLICELTSLIFVLFILYTLRLYYFFFHFIHKYAQIHMQSFALSMLIVRIFFPTVFRLASTVVYHLVILSSILRFFLFSLQAYSFKFVFFFLFRASVTINSIIQLNWRSLFIKRKIK